MTFRSDLDVDLLSDALDGKSLDLVVTGSIGAVESVRFCRSLRRLGADVQVWMTSGAAQFTTETALAWASGKAVRTHFSGEITHLAEREACIVAPASASFIGKLAGGISDSPAAALVCSYLGQKKPLFILPNMHDSLANSPMIGTNLERLAAFCIVLSSRQEEGKHKFPDPATLADEVAHRINQKDAGPSTLVAMGTTRGYIDQVRYISNYSSGALGSQIAEELYRSGFTTHVVNGPSKISPRCFSYKVDVRTNEDMTAACTEALCHPIQPAQALVMLASVLDFIPADTFTGKIKSSDDLKVDFVKAQKIIASLHPSSGLKIGFKLEADLDEKKAQIIAQDYFQRYQLSLMVLNQLSQVSDLKHQAFVISYDKDTRQPVVKVAESKSEIAKLIKNHLLAASRS